MLHLDRHYLTIIIYLIHVGFLLNNIIYFCLFFFQVPYSPPEDFKIKSVDCKRKISTFFSYEICIAWPPIHSDQIHLTPAHGRRSSGMKTDSS